MDHPIFVAKAGGRWNSGRLGGLHLRLFAGAALGYAYSGDNYSSGSSALLVGETGFRIDFAKRFYVLHRLGISLRLADGQPLFGAEVLTGLYLR